MAAQQTLPAMRPDSLKVAPVAAFPNLRVLEWRDDWLYASHGYSLLRARITMNTDAIDWQPVASYAPEWWRTISVKSGLTYRLVRDGFHALTTLSSGHIVAAVSGAIVTLAQGKNQFQLSHRVLRGT